MVAAILRSERIEIPNLAIQSNLRDFVNQIEVIVAEPVINIQCQDVLTYRIGVKNIGTVKVV